VIQKLIWAQKCILQKKAAKAPKALLVKEDCISKVFVKAISK
jgi:hypothetical protein